MLCTDPKFQSGRIASSWTTRTIHISKNTFTNISSKNSFNMMLIMNIWYLSLITWKPYPFRSWWHCPSSKLSTESYLRHRKPRTRKSGRGVAVQFLRKSCWAPLDGSPLAGSVDWTRQSKHIHLKIGQLQFVHFFHRNWQSNNVVTWSAKCMVRKVSWAAGSRS